MAARKLEWGVLGVALVWFLVDAGAGAGWAAASTRSVLAVRMEHSAGAPLYDVIAGVAALLPFGEAGFRLGVLGAVLGACAVAGVVAAARVIVPKEPMAGVVAALVVALAAPFREALATPQVMSACGIVWAIAWTVGYVRAAEAERDVRDALLAVIASGVVIGSAPWLGAGVAVVVVSWLVHSSTKTSTRTHTRMIVGAVAGLGVMIVLLWFDAIGSVPGLHVSLADAVAASGRGAGAVVIGGGLIGLGFGAATGLPRAGALVAIAIGVAVHEVVIGGAAAAMVVVFALGIAILVAAIARLVVGELVGAKRDAAVFACGVPLVIAALASGAAVLVEDPGDSPRRLAGDLVDAMPTGPGTFVTTRATPWFALQYERAVAGMRPDLVLVPPTAPERADVIVATALRAHTTIGADASAFGRLDAELAIPRGRGFQLVAKAPEQATPVEPPADYTTPTGADENLALAIERAGLEAASGRLAAAARAAGLTKRFGAADLAVLAATTPGADHPALFGFLPLGSTPRGPWLLDVLGDDLAWVANIPQAEPPIDAPMPRRLHALWRQIFMQRIAADAPEIRALGPEAVAATAELMKVFPRHP